jgi:hypothetical protein
MDKMEMDKKEISKWKIIVLIHFYIWKSNISLFLCNPIEFNQLEHHVLRPRPPLKIE